VPCANRDQQAGVLARSLRLPLAARVRRRLCEPGASGRPCSGCWERSCCAPTPQSEDSRLGRNPSRNQCAGRSICVGECHRFPFRHERAAAIGRAGGSRRHGHDGRAPGDNGSRAGSQASSRAHRHRGHSQALRATRTRAPRDRDRALSLGSRRCGRNRVSYLSRSTSRATLDGPRLRPRDSGCLRDGDRPGPRDRRQGSDRFGTVGSGGRPPGLWDRLGTRTNNALGAADVQASLERKKGTLLVG
jgi:hypothetical protein